MGALRRYAAAKAVRIIAVFTLAGLGAVVGVLALSHAVSAPAFAPGAPVEVAASFDHAFVQFGDRITARVVVALDTRRVQPRTLRIADDLAPLTQLGAGLLHGPLDAGQPRRLVTLSAVPVACLTSACVVPVVVRHGSACRSFGHQSWGKVDGPCALPRGGPTLSVPEGG